MIKINVVWLLLIFALQTSCDEDYVKLYKDNTELLNETAFLLTNEYENIINSDTCSRKKQINYYIKKNIMLSCNVNVSAQLMNNLNKLFSEDLLTTIVGNKNYVEFYWKREVDAGISTVYSFVYINDGNYINNLKNDTNAYVKQMNPKWFFIKYENDD